MPTKRKPRAPDKRRPYAGRGRTPAPAGRGGGAVSWFPGVGRGRLRFGIGVLAAIVEAAGGRPEIRVMRRASFAPKPAGRHRQRLLESVGESDLARVLAGLGQPQRIRIGRAILSGANTHHALSKAVHLAPGPLYHHLRSLERSGLLQIVERNRYDLTRLGRDLILLVSVVIWSACRR